MVVCRLIVFLQLSLSYVWAVLDSRWRCEECGCIGIIEDDDGEADRDNLRCMLCSKQSEPEVQGRSIIIS